MKCFALLLMVVCGMSQATAGVIDRAQQAEGQQDWSAWGGTVGVHWNRDLLHDYGVTIERPTDQVRSPDARPHQWFDLRQTGGLKFEVVNNALRKFDSGSLQARGGFVLDLADGSHIDLRNFTVRLRPHDAQILDVLGADGKAWFYIDKIMFELVQNKTRLAIKAADLRVTPALATRIGHREIANYAIADMVFDSEIYVQGSNQVPKRECSPYPWPNVAVPSGGGSIYQADLFMYGIQPQYMRCQGCSSGSNDGKVMFAPDSTLKNNVNDGSLGSTIGGDPLGSSKAPYTADIAWHTMFSGDSEPYNNDQHPFLIWNLYRVDPDGSIHQIGRSGVKHAWLTTNNGCLDSCYDSHNLGLGCTDTYSTGNNDASYDLGPRSEIVPAKGLWGRCGSKWDPDCDGNGEHFINGNGSYDDRMLVNESQMGSSNHSGSTYLFESWYLARDDINIYNSMASVNVNVAKNGSAWVMNGANGYELGGAIDRWVDPMTPGPGELNEELVKPEGHAKVAVKVADLGNGSWRYDYAVMNFDFSRAVTEEVGGDGTDHLRVLSNAGFDSFSIPLPSAGSATAVSFDDGDVDSGNNWTPAVTSGAVTWTAPTGNTLDWGSMYSFSVTVSAAPVASSSTLHVAESGSPAAYSVDTLGPPSVDPADVILKDGFDGTPPTSNP